MSNDQDENVLDLARLGESNDDRVRIRAALLSIHTHVERHRPPLDALLGEVIPVPIPQTAAILRANGEQRLRPSRLYRMAIRYVSLAANPHAPNWIRQQARREASDVLGPAKVEAILKELAQRESGGRQDGICVETLVADEVGPALIGNCEWYPAKVQVTLNGKSIHLNTRPVFKKQTLAKAAEGLDPRSWAHCCPTLWEMTRLCQLGPDGGPVTGPDGECEPLPEGEIPIGGDYGHSRLLHEKFICHGACSVELHLRARVIFPSHSAEYLLHYSNPAMLSGPEILPDEGRVSISQTGNSLLVDSFKKFGYTDYASAIAIYLVLAHIESAHYLGELICCKS